MDTVTQSVGISRLLKPPLDSNAPVSIFWDFENCHVPIDVDPDGIAGNIKAALFDYGLTGPLTIRAYGNLGTLGRRVQVALINSGVEVRDVPPGKWPGTPTEMLVIPVGCLQDLSNARWDIVLEVSWILQLSLSQRQSLLRIRNAHVRMVSAPSPGRPY